MTMKRLTIFSEGELRRMMDGNVVSTVDTDGVIHLYMSQSEHEKRVKSYKETKDD